MVKTKLGKFSVSFVALMFLLFFLGSFLAKSFYKSTSAGKTILEDIFKRPLLSITMLFGFACGIGGFITGIFAIFRKKERSVLVYMATLIGMLLVFFLFGEILFPH